MLSLTCELATTVGTAPPPTSVLVTVPRSTNRYSSLAVHGPESTHSEPPPTVHPAWVLIAVPLAICVNGAPNGTPLFVSCTVFVTLGFDSISPKAAPPVTKSMTWSHGRKPTRPRAVPNQRSFWSTPTTFVVTVQIAPAQAVVLTAGGLSVPFCHVPCRSTSSPTTKLRLACQLKPACPPNTPPSMWVEPATGAKPVIA